MEHNEFKSYINLAPFRRFMTVHNVNKLALAKELDISNSVISRANTGSRIPPLETFLKICAHFQISINELVEFTGYETKERFKEPYFIPYEPEKDTVNKVSYEPLRQLFYQAYGDKCKDKLNEFFSKVEPVEHSEAQNKMYEEAIKRNHDFIHRARKDGKESQHIDYNGGINAYQRSKIRTDQPISMALLYNICKALGCQPDYVVSYR